MSEVFVSAYTGCSTLMMFLLTMQWTMMKKTRSMSSVSRDYLRDYMPRAVKLSKNFDFGCSVQTG
ncbi:hypothetical protein ALQ60_200227 [Pseudomonas syringae pv. papulans]|nr:hypothetical protein ALO65_200142 [Pseudomonas syringae pv. papulans]KWS39577.1 hypothetical protein AL059_25255 [Pseudomonas syringae pv. papulans]RMN45286.1 hypothetical protein ALQ60_200227 [Pseudomonas syringae pv. papulans]RMN60593.1 hypothetical protein ALQ56_200244 [Pseudomonas syringae pv. papulans]RMV37137.1 hypothetical protein ALP11_200064 [Pseudomonas syringae pv. papulans]